MDIFMGILLFAMFIMVILLFKNNHVCKMHHQAIDLLYGAAGNRTSDDFERLRSKYINALDWSRYGYSRHLHDPFLWTFDQMFKGMKEEVEEVFGK